MIDELRLQKRDESIISLGKVYFVNQDLPFTKYLPKDTDMQRKVDMIIGGDCVWQHVFKEPFEIKTDCNLLNLGQIMNLEIGQLWLGTAQPSQSSINHVTIY